MVRIDSFEKLILSIDQGTSNSRVIVFSTYDWRVIYMKKVEFESISPNEGWWEQDPMQILTTINLLLNDVAAYLISNSFSLDQVVGVGIANQRETVVCWDKTNGSPLCNAILWKDIRTQSIVDEMIRNSSKGKDLHKEVTGLPMNSYFSACKIKWLLENVPEVQLARDEERLMVGTVDTWLIWNLTGKTSYVTDVTNASRTMLMNINTLEWDADLCDYFGVDKNILAQICSSAEDYGVMNFEGCSFKNVPITGCLGDQQAAMIGQRCFKKGMAKNTFGTGSFMLYNVGEKVVYSKHGLVSTVAYQFGRDAKPIYALEGSKATSGEAVQLLVGLQIIKDASQLEECAKTEKDNGGVYIVPAFNGLLAPHWRPNAKSLITFLPTMRKGHICRAVIEAIAFQILEILKAMENDSGFDLQVLHVDGGMTTNELLMQTQADVLGIDVVRPNMVETTALGAAMAAAYTLKLWKFEANELHGSSQIFRPQLEKHVKEEMFARWQELVDKC